jgi:hypothetical protein
MSFGDAIALVQKFATKTTPGAFPNLGVSRQQVAHDLMERINSPSAIDQGSSSLCGPAVFLFSLLHKSPEVFAKYVIDLYDTGQAKIGDLMVKPGQDCRNYRPVSDVAPVDWVALASMRDGANKMFDYDSPGVQFGGITLPGDLATWFRKAGFAQVENRTNLLFDKDLLTLLRACEKLASGAAVCLFVGASLLSGGLGGTTIPDHWVSLTAPIRIDGATLASLLARGAKVNDDKTLAQSGISFEVFTWGETSYPVRKFRPQLTVKTCLDYFYGYVSAK